MAPTTKFLLPEDDGSEYSSGNRDSNSISPSEVPRSLLVEARHLDHNKTEPFPPYIERMAEPTTVVIGFGDFVPRKPKEKTKYEPVPLKPVYPPPGNENYYLTSDGHDPKFVVNKARPIITMPSRRKLTGYALSDVPRPKSHLLEIAEETTRRRESLSDTPTPTRARRETSVESTASTSTVYGPTSPTDGEHLAGAINWNKSGWEAHIPFATDFYPAEEQRADFIKAIDDYAKTSLQGFRRDAPHLLLPPPIDREHPPKLQLEYCKRCGKNHIRPGSPATLPDRDTCGAYLPDWYPSQDFDKPWESFKVLYNKIVTCEEIERGYKQTSDQSKSPVWDMEYYDEHPKWRSAGRHMGWWKCRSGENAPEVERNCELCHRLKPAEDRTTAEAEKVIALSEQKKELEKWIEDHMKRIGLEDMALAMEMIRRMKPQEILGCFPSYRVPQEELDGYDTGNDSDPDGDRELELIREREWLEMREREEQGVQQREETEVRGSRVASLVPRRPTLNPVLLPSPSASTLDLGEKHPGVDKENEMLSLHRTTTASSSSSEGGLSMRSPKGFLRK